MEAENYFPSNGTEGMEFIAKYCDNCYKEKYCIILTNSMIGKEPKQWIYDKNGNPYCTSQKTERSKRNKNKNLLKRLPKLF
jgi:hypothetical protein